jgi:membrane protease subunit HflK
VRPPEQVQAAFDDVLQAGQERERAKNEAQAYANDVIPRARGAASRLSRSPKATRPDRGAGAGRCQRFKSLLAEYQRAPQVTRDRLYIETMQQIYGNVTKVLVDSRRAPTCCSCRWTRSCSRWPGRRRPRRPARPPPRRAAARGRRRSAHPRQRRSRERESR